MALCPACGVSEGIVECLDLPRWLCLSCAFVERRARALAPVTPEPLPARRYFTKGIEARALPKAVTLPTQYATWPELVAAELKGQR